MIRNYFKTAWRSVLKNRLSSVISIIGLATAIAAFLLTSSYIVNELRFNKFHKNADSIVRAAFYYKSAADPEPTGVSLTGTALVPVAKREIAGVENGVRLYNYSGRIFTHGQKSFKEKNLFMADAEFFSIFSFPFIEGNPATALQNPYSLVLTRSAAEKYFGKENALGKALTVAKDTAVWQVTGVVEDLPSYSSVRFDMIGSYNSMPRSKTENWGAANDISYLLLKPGADKALVESGINSHIKKALAEYLADGSNMWVELEPLKDIHLHSKVAAEGNVTYLYIFGIIGLLMLMVACINFTNLVTAKSLQRAKEIGIRKAIGATSGNVFLQFMSESLLITFIALCIGIGAALLALPVFSSGLGLELNFLVWHPGVLAAVLILLFIVLSLLSGAWPAFIISRFKPVLALKEKSTPGSSSSKLQKFLVILQFTVSVTFVISAFIIKKQLFFLQHTDTGINREHVVVLETSSVKANDLSVLKNELLKNSDIKAVSASYHLPTDIGGGYSLRLAGSPEGEELNVTGVPVDKDFIDALDIEIMAGTNFSYTDEQLAKETDESKKETAFMINESAAKALGLTLEDALNKEVFMNGRQGRIKAVVRDFNFSSLRNAISPIVIFTEYYWFGDILIRTSGNTTAVTMGKVAEAWKTVKPEEPFEYTFLDEAYSRLYKTDQRTSFIINVFSLIAIAVSCLGLFGLSVQMVLQRTKEIGIRKVLGATSAQIALLISRDFLKLVLIAIILAVPVAWYFTHKWLADFAYRTAVTPALFFMVALMAIAVAALAVGYHAVKAAIANPVKALRSE